MITRSTLTFGLASTLTLAFGFGLFGCDGTNAVDAMKKADEDVVVEGKKEGEKKELPPDPRHMGDPSDEQLAAWNRKDPEGEKHLYKWDKAHAKDMQNYWKELRCLRDKVKLEGAKAFGTEPGGLEQETWEQFKLAMNASVLDPWQARFFAAEGTDVLSKSKVAGDILEAHELVSLHFPSAYNDGDEMAIKVQDARWTVVENKVVDYYSKVGAPMTFPDLTDPKELAKWEKFCAPVLLPPKVKKKK
jgi:hypothetical protein